MNLPAIIAYQPVLGVHPKGGLGDDKEALRFRLQLSVEAQTKGILPSQLAPQRTRKALKKLALHGTQEVLSLSIIDGVKSLVLQYLLH